MRDLKTERGLALRKAREAAGLSASQLVERAKKMSTKEFQLSDAAIYSYELGQNLLGEKVARSLADALRIPVHRLMIGDPACSEERLLEVKNFLSNVSIYERKKVQACILFADLVGSTEFKRYHSIREGLAKVVQHNEVVRECVERSGGRAVKYVGDCVMAMFEGEKSEFRAVKSGLETILQMKVANEKHKWQYPYSMDTKIGINSGPVWMFEYDNSTEDPQGITVDIAARLSSLAGPNQVLCTNETYTIAQEAGGIPIPSAEFKRYLKGIKDRFDIRAIVPEGYKYEPWDVEGPSHEIKNRLEQAYRLLHEKKSKEAFSAFKQIADEYPDDYVSNIFVAEYLLMEGAATDQEYKDKLYKVEEHIDKAMCSRPNSCHVWLLLGSLHFKYFEIDRDRVHIERAIDCARKAVHFANDWQNTGGLLQAKVCLILFLQALAKHRKDQRALDEAKKLCVELEPYIVNAFNDCRSDFYVAYASVQLQSGSTDFEKIEEMINRAKELNRRNFRVCELERDLIKCRFSDGGVAGVFKVSPFE